MSNPYTSPETKSDSAGVARSHKRRTWLLCLSAGTIGAISVYLGDWLEWPHFNRRAGFIGTDFMSPLLYAINDPYAIHIVAAVWFSYAAMLAATLTWTYHALIQRR